MTHLQAQWEGVSLPRNYTLEEKLAGDESGAFFQASSAEGRRAIVKFVREASGDDSVTPDLWHRIRHLRHPNLIELLDCGRAEHEGEVVLYAVFESPDETLDAALSRSALDTQESREVVDAVLDALRYLHAQGLVLGVLDTEHVMAVGDRIKLWTGAIREAATSADYRQDVRLFGELWQQALMAASPESERIAARAADPNPQTRWTLAEIRAALNPAPRVEPAPPPAEPTRASAPVSVEKRGETSAASSGQRSQSYPVISPDYVADPPVRNDAPSLPPSQRRMPEPVPAFRFPRWILVGTGIFLLLIFALNRSRRAEVTSQPPAVSAPATTGAPVAKPAPNPPVEVLPKPSTAQAREVWRVIAFTFRTWNAAAKKVEQINRFHPTLHATVFSPKGQAGYFLVALGGRMTHEDAVRLQHSARGRGLPRDVYVQNYSD